MNMNNIKPSINYYTLLKAMEWYSDEYGQTEVPWKVSKEAISYTFDKEDITNSTQDGKHLIGSAEQGFIELILQNTLPKGKWMSMSPCFRNDEEDRWHQKEFIKLELFQNIHVNKNQLNQMIQKFVKFCIKFVNENLIVVKSTNDINSVTSYDVEINGIEVGSFGIREKNGMSWIYGTGIALPRFSEALKNSTRV